MKERLTDRECWDLLAQLFPRGLDDPALLEELAPDGWERSPLVRVFHPTVEQAYDELLRMRENLKIFRTSRTLAEETDPFSEDETPSFENFKKEFQSGSIQPTEECIDVLGRCLWDMFSDNHHVWTDDGRLVDLGAFRGSAGFIANFRDRNEEGWERGDDMDFYMGTALVQHRADLTPVYELMFRRMLSLDLDWEYSHPRLSLTDLSGLKEQLEDADDTSKVYRYDPTESYWKEKEEAKRKKDIAEMQAYLDEGYRESVEEAQRHPPPTIVQAYQRVYGRWPSGWPPRG